MNTVFLFTKQFPFGHLETYVYNELQYLNEKFDAVIIVPIDEYSSRLCNHDLSQFEKVEIFEINKATLKAGLLQRISRHAICLGILLKEIFVARDGMEHLYNFSFAFTHLKVCFQQAIALRHFIETRNISPDHIIFYNYWLYKNVITCALHNRVAETSIPIISRAHSGDLYHSTWYQINAGANITFLPFEHFKVKATQRIFCISSHGLHHLQRTFPQYKSKFELARLGVRKSASINKILDKGLFQIVTCSLISANKRIHLMPEILSHLRDLNIIWTHFGWGDDAIVHELKQSIAHHRVESVCHLRGTVPNAEITRMYETEQVNLLVNLSRAEGIPVSIMEAFSFGVPAIATSTVGNPEIVDTDSGYLIPVDFSIEHIAQLIRQLATDEALQQKLRDGARRKFESHFDAQINYSHFAAELGEICNSRNSGQSM